MHWFNRPETRYNAPAERQSPFARASQEWDNRIGSARVQARNWRLMAFGAMLLSAVLAVCLTWLGAQSSVLTYIVELEKTGQPGRIQLANNRYQPTTHQVAYYIRKVVEQVRSIPTDPVVLRQNWLVAYKYLSGDAVQRMNEQGASLEDAADKHHNTRSVQVTSVIHRSDSSFQVRWVETTFVNGSMAGTEHYTGLFTYEVNPPQDEQQVFDNPLGVYITDFTWSREFDGQDL